MMDILLLSVTGIAALAVGLGLGWWLARRKRRDEQWLDAYTQAALAIGVLRVNDAATMRSRLVTVIDMKLWTLDALGATSKRVRRSMTPECDQALADYRQARQNAEIHNADSAHETPGHTP